MAHKSKPLINSVLKKAITLLPSLICVAYRVGTAAAVEARLAGRSLTVMLVLSFFIAALLASAWLCLLGLFALYLVSLHWSWMMSISIAFGLNLILIGFVLLYFSRLRKNFLFSETREQLRKAKIK
jgi:hypothetical protein